MPLATPSELASYLQQDVDTSSATLALAIASARFELESETKFAVTAATYQVEGWGQPVICIPRGPLVAIVQVRLDGVVLAAGTDYTAVMSNLYRTIGWGRMLGPIATMNAYVGWPPQLVEVDYTYGYASVPDDVKGAVLELAGEAYDHPDLATASESIDDYTRQMARGSGGFQLSESGLALAEKYRTGGFA